MEPEAPARAPIPADAPRRDAAILNAGLFLLALGALIIVPEVLEMEETQGNALALNLALYGVGLTGLSLLAGLASAAARLRAATAGHGALWTQLVLAGLGFLLLLAALLAATVSAATAE